MWDEITMEPSGKTRNVLLKLQNLVNFHAHSLQIMFILSLITGHLFWKATFLGGLYRGVPLYLSIHKLKQRNHWSLFGNG